MQTMYNFWAFLELSNTVRNLSAPLPTPPGIYPTLRGRGGAAGAPAAAAGASGAAAAGAGVEAGAAATGAGTAGPGPQAKAVADAGAGAVAGVGVEAQAAANDGVQPMDADVAGPEGQQSHGEAGCSVQAVPPSGLDAGAGSSGQQQQQPSLAADPRFQRLRLSQVRRV